MSRNRGFLPKLSRRTWQVLAADGVAALGTGAVLPFLMVYLRDVRGIHVTTAGLALATIAIVALVLGPAAGPLIDRFGSRRSLMGALVVFACGSISIALIDRPWHAFLSAAILGTGFAALWPATHSLLASLVEPHQRSAVFAVHYTTLNAGIGLGGIAGGFFADLGDPRSFEILYILDALSWLVFAAVLFVMKDIGGPLSDHERAEPSGGYRAVWADKAFVRLMVIAAILVTIGYSQLESGFPAFITEAGGASTRVLGVAFAANTLVIVLAQLIALRWLEGKRRTRALYALCVLWALAWSTTLGSVWIAPGAVATVGFVAAMALFALGECLVSPTIPGMLNDLASDRLRGRYNATYSLMFSLGHIVGPALAGIMLGRELGGTLFAGLVIVSLLTMILVRRLELRVPEGANIVSASDEPETPTPRDKETIAIN